MWSHRTKWLDLTKTIVRILLYSFLIGLGTSLSYLFLNFHLELLGFSRQEIGYANAIPLLALVVLVLPLSFLIPRMGYVQSLLGGAAFSALGMLLVAQGKLVFFSLFLFGAGEALVMGATAPLLAVIVNSERWITIYSIKEALSVGAGFIGSLLGGLLPGWIGESRVMYGVCLCMVLAFIVLLGAPNVRGKSKQFYITHSRTWVRLLLPQALIGIGAGLIIPFLNLYVAQKFNLPYASIGGLFAFASLATALAMLLQPFLVKRLGKVTAIVVVWTASLPFLAILGWVNYLPLVAVALFIRGALMNSAGPVYITLCMEVLDAGERPGYLLTQTALWNLANALAAAISGRIQQEFGIDGFNYLFAGTLLLYAIAIVLAAMLLWNTGRQGSINK